MSILEKLKAHRAEQRLQLVSNPLYTKEYRLKYITSNSAFNIPYNGMQCDWHQVDMLRGGRYVTHPTNFIGAEDILGDYGLWDCSDWFASKGINKKSLCATPIRAIVDKLYYELAICNAYPKNFDDFWNYMFDELNISELREKLKILKEHLKPQQQKWLSLWEQRNEIYQKR